MIIDLILKKSPVKRKLFTSNKIYSFLYSFAKQNPKNFITFVPL